LTIYPTILFDGVCNFCNGAVNFTIRRDRKKQLRFASLQSAAAAQLLKAHRWPAEDMKSFLLIENGRLYHRSTAALRVCRYLGGLWPLCMALLVIPRFIRDGIYDIIARNRYRWFGQRETCMIPTPEIRERFLE
jgi:predicted DCC family thiol-disulfide oxidoreductase YuxK